MKMCKNCAKQYFCNKENVILKVGYILKTMER